MEQDLFTPPLPFYTHPPLSNGIFCTDVRLYAHIRSYSRLVPPEWPSPPHHLPARESFGTTGAFQTNGVLRRRPPTLHGATTNVSCLTFASGAGSAPRSAWWVREHAIGLPNQTSGCMSKHKNRQASIGEINKWPETVFFFP